jgi:hypothetical protein
MLTDAQRRECAANLYNAELTQTVIPQISKTHPGADLDDAYAIQRYWAALHTAKGARIVGHKIGLTSRAIFLNPILAICLTVCSLPTARIFLRDALANHALKLSCRL